MQACGNRPEGPSANNGNCNSPPPLGLNRSCLEGGDHHVQDGSGKEVRSVSQCLFLEVFAGTAGLTAAVRKIGLHSSVGVDNSVPTKCKAPIIRLDLTTSHGIQLLWEVLRRPHLVGVHLAPPCGTASRAREIKRKKGPNPVPLRSGSMG